MRKITTVLSLVFLLFCQIYLPHAEEETLSYDENHTYSAENLEGYTATELTVYDGPDEKYKKIGTITSQTDVKITGKCIETGWYKIEWENAEEAWVNGFFVIQGSLEKEEQTEQKETEEETESESEIVVSEDNIAAFIKYIEPVEPLENIESDIDTDSNEWDSVIEPYGSVSEERLNAANEQLNRAPAALRHAFMKGGWKYYLSEYDVDDTFANGKYGSLQGITYYEDRVIYLDNRGIAIEEATLHEFGHYVDWYYGTVSSSNMFKSIYNTEGDQFCSYYNFHNGVYNYDELFAEAFCQYIKDPETLHSSFPYLYQFINTLIPSE